MVRDVNSRLEDIFCWVVMLLLLPPTRSLYYSYQDSIFILQEEVKEEDEEEEEKIVGLKEIGNFHSLISSSSTSILPLGYLVYLIPFSFGQ